MFIVTEYAALSNGFKYGFNIKFEGPQQQVFNLIAIITLTVASPFDFPIHVLCGKIIGRFL